MCVDTWAQDVHRRAATCVRAPAHPRTPVPCTRLILNIQLLKGDFFKKGVKVPAMNDPKSKFQKWSHLPLHPEE